MTLHTINLSVDVIAESREDAENLLCKIMDMAFIYGMGLSEHTAHDREPGTDGVRIFDYRVEE